MYAAMGKPTDQETTAIEKTVYIPSSPKRGQPCLQGHMGKNQGGSGGARSEEELWGGDVLVVSTGTDKAGCAD